MWSTAELSGRSLTGSIFVMVAVRDEFADRGFETNGPLFAQAN
jgi:hypothetical protein